MKLFKRKQYSEVQDEGEWWKDPRLGTDDDEGAYDYYACNKPDNSTKWCWSTCKCDDCGKEPRFKRYGEQWNAYWYCYDGWDGDSGFVCWKCLLKSKIYNIKSKINRKIRARKEYHSWIRHFKEKGIEITEELKKTTLNIVSREVTR